METEKKRPQKLQSRPRKLFTKKETKGEAKPSDNVRKGQRRGREQPVLRINAYKQRNLAPRQGRRITERYTRGGTERLGPIPKRELHAKKRLSEIKNPQSDFRASSTGWRIRRTHVGGKSGVKRR